MIHHPLAYVSPTSTCSSFLETLCDQLFDYLRPRILHEPSLTVLCQVCTVLQALMVLDTTDDDDSSGSPSPPSSPLLSPTIYLQGVHSSYSPGSNMSPRSKYPRAAYFDGEKQPSRRKLEIKGLLEPVLQDAQTRLVFRSQAVLQNGIGRFVGSGEDLEYPEKIEKGE